jgi:hypothetical protein
MNKLADAQVESLFGRGGDQTQHISARSQTLYRVRYPVPHKTMLLLLLLLCVCVCVFVCVYVCV